VLGVLVVILFAGCGSIRSNERPVVVKRAQMHMGTLVSITAVAPGSEIAQASIDAGFHEIKRLEQLLSTWIATSELSQVNAAAGRQPVGVGPETLELVLRSLEMAGLTEGGFNIAVGPAVEAWSVTERQRIPNQGELQALKPLIDWSIIQIDRQAHTIFLPKPGMRIDVGGIGKGYTADRVAEVMRKAGAQGGVVALSGDIKTFGDLPGMNGFPVGIRHPLRPVIMNGILSRVGSAITISSIRSRYSRRGNARVSRS
jgi:thiamine biosynthesis lipoprotein